MITHPFHPFKGMRLEVLKSRRVGGEDQITLRRPEGGTFPVARDWTDRSDPTASDLLGRSVAHDPHRLLLLAKLVRDLEDAHESDSHIDNE